MSDTTQVGPTANPTQPIAGNTMNATKLTGLGAVVVGVGAGLATALDAFDNEPTAVVIAVLATIAVAMAVTGYVTATDMRVRNRQTVVDNYLRYLRDRPSAQPEPKRNGHDAHLMAPGVPTRVKLIGKEDDPIWQLLAVKVDMDEGKQLTSFLAGNGVEQPSWFKQDEIRVLDLS
jgi:hypothetical protein